MSSLDKAIQSQLSNIEARSGRSLADLAALIRSSGLEKHGEIRDMLKRDLGMGHGDANTLVHHVLKSDGASAAAEQGLSTGDVLDAIYEGPKAALRPIHDRLMESIKTFGEFEIAPKKGYVSLRRRRQFAMIGPGTKSRVDVGLNMTGVAPTDRLIALPPKGMCQYQVRVTSADEVNDELIAWVRQAWDQSG
jgi:hypothetical protein